MHGCAQAQVEQWIDYSTLELDAPLMSWILPILGYWDYNQKVEVLSYPAHLFHKQIGTWHIRACYRTDTCLLGCDRKKRQRLRR